MDFLKDFWNFAVYLNLRCCKLSIDFMLKIIVIGATNRLDSIDPALRRPGRFDREMRFDLPDASARHSILDIHTKSWAECRPHAETMRWLAETTSGYCGADLKA